MDHRRAPWGSGSGVPYSVQSCPCLFSVHLLHWLHIFAVQVAFCWGVGGWRGASPPALTLHAQPGPCPVPSLPASVSGPQVQFPRKKPTWPCRSGAPVDPDTQGQRTKPGEGSRGRSQGDPGKAPSGGLERSGGPKESSSGSPFMDVCQPVVDLHRYLIMGSRVSGC